MRMYPAFNNIQPRNHPHVRRASSNASMDSQIRIQRILELYSHAVKAEGEELDAAIAELRKLISSSPHDMHEETRSKTS